MASNCFMSSVCLSWLLLKLLCYLLSVVVWLYTCSLYLNYNLHDVFVLASVICCFHLAATFILLMFVHLPSSEILLLWSSFTSVFLSYDHSSDIHGYFISSLRDIH